MWPRCTHDIVPELATVWEELKEQINHLTLPFCKFLSQRIALLRWTIYKVQIILTRDPVFSRFLRVNRVKVSIKVVRIELRLKVKAKLGADPALVLLSVELDELPHRGIDPRRGVRGWPAEGKQN